MCVASAMAYHLQRSRDPIDFAIEICPRPRPNRQGYDLGARDGTDHYERLRFGRTVALGQTVQPRGMRGARHVHRADRWFAAKERCSRANSLVEGLRVTLTVARSRQRRHVDGDDGMRIAAEEATPALDAPRFRRDVLDPASRE